MTAHCRAADGVYYSLFEFRKINPPNGDKLAAIFRISGVTRAATWAMARLGYHNPDIASDGNGEWRETPQ